MRKSNRGGKLMEKAWRRKGIDEGLREGDMAGAGTFFHKLPRWEDASPQPISRAPARVCCSTGELLHQRRSSNSKTVAVAASQKAGAPQAFTFPFFFFGASSREEESKSESDDDDARFLFFFPFLPSFFFFSSSLAFSRPPSCPLCRPPSCPPSCPPSRPPSLLQPGPPSPNSIASLVQTKPRY